MQARFNQIFTSTERLTQQSYLKRTNTCLTPPSLTRIFYYAKKGHEVAGWDYYASYYACYKGLLLFCIIIQRLLLYFFLLFFVIIMMSFCHVTAVVPKLVYYNNSFIPVFAVAR